jgi:hypothetical protein
VGEVKRVGERQPASTDAGIGRNLRRRGHVEAVMKLLRTTSSLVLAFAVAVAVLGACGGTGEGSTTSGRQDDRDSSGSSESSDEDGKDPVAPVRNCADVLGVVRSHAPHYDTQRDLALVGPDDPVLQCSITYTVSPVLDELGNYLELGVRDEIMVVMNIGDVERPEACPPVGHCVETQDQHVPESPGIPAFDVVHTTVDTQDVLLSASEETHGPQTATDQIVQIALDIQEGLAS